MVEDVVVVVVRIHIIRDYRSLRFFLASCSDRRPLLVVLDLSTRFSVGRAVGGLDFVNKIYNNFLLAIGLAQLEVLGLRRFNLTLISLVLVLSLTRRLLVVANDVLELLLTGLGVDFVSVVISLIRFNVDVAVLSFLAIFFIIYCVPEVCGFLWLLSIKLVSLFRLVVLLR